MTSMSLFIELLRTRPRLLFWTMAILQAVLWTAIPALFYAAPPGQLPLLLAIGHEFQFGTEFGPPLALWLAELAYRMLGMTGVYLLSQICIVVTLWAVFALGRAIVGAQFAAIAVMLMAGVAVFSVPTPEFGPAILATPLWALILMHYWTGAQQGRWQSWLLVGIEAGLLLLTTYAGFILIALLLIYMLATPSGRVQFGHIGPWIGGVAMTFVLFPYLIWLDLGAGLFSFDLPTIIANLHAWGWMLLALLLSHIGMLILILIGRGSVIASPAPAPEVVGTAADPAARWFVYFFALAPVVAMGLFVLLTRRPENFLMAPLVVLSGLAVVVAAGERIKIEHQYVIGYAWLALIVLPPVMVALAIVVQPWVLAADLKVGRPAAAMGEFFGDNFARRTGQPLEVVGGDPALATLIALGASSRPSLYGETSLDDRFRITREDIAEKGAVLVWRATDTAGKPPPVIAQQFPDIVPEVPHAFERPFQGRMAPLRVGWAMIRPRSQANAPTPAAVPPAPAEPAQPAVQPPPPEPVRPAPPVSTRPAGPGGPAVVQSQPRPEEPSTSADPPIMAPEPPPSAHQQQRRRPRIVPYQNMHRVQ